MSRKFRNRRRQIGKLGLRTILVASLIGATGILTASLFLISYFREESSMAATDPMVVSEIVIIQNNAPLFKGSQMQLMVGVKVKVKGNSNKLKVVSFEFSSQGTSRPINETVHNARLWNTGKQDFFTPIRQLNASFPSIPEDIYNLNAGTILNEGDNYFWLTYDIAPNRAGNHLTAEADLVSVNIGTLKYNPDRVSLGGSKSIINNIPYFSMGNGDISSLNSWNSSRDGSGTRPASFNEAGATFFIQSGHVMTNSVSGCIPAIIIERNGVLRSGSDVKSDYLDVQSGGTYIQEKSFSDFSKLKQFTIRNNGNYLHSNEGALPGKDKNFEPHSTTTLNNYSDSTFKNSVVWGNLIVDVKNAVPSDLGRCLRKIKGNLEIRATGTSGYLYTSQSDTIEVYGNFSMMGGRLILAPAGNTTTLSVEGQFILDKGYLSDHLPGKNNKGSALFVPGSLMLIRSGTFYLKGNNSQLVFTASNTTWNQSGGDVLLPDITIASGATLNLIGDKMGVLGDKKHFIVKGDAVLHTCNTIISGAGKFILEDFGTLSTENSEGINSSLLKGAIQTGSVYFSSSANYMYKGSHTPQTTGVFLTHPNEGRVNNLVISKSRISDVVILQQPIIINGRLDQQRGNINKNSFSLQFEEKRKTVTAARGF